MTPFDMNALKDRAERDALRHSRNQRAAGKGDVPAVALALGAPAEFEGDAPEHQIGTPGAGAGSSGVGPATGAGVGLPLDVDPGMVDEVLVLAVGPEILALTPKTALETN